MNSSTHHIPYRQTGFFNKTVLNYIDQEQTLKSFFSHTPNLSGLKTCIEQRKSVPVNRELIVQELKKQYSKVENADLVNQNIDLLLLEKTFTINTAHQPNIFTGPLYFLYKIIHAIKLAAHCKTSFPQNEFVPVFFLGSEDDDLEELNHINLNGEKIIWKTGQKGAVGRMVIDENLIKLIESISGQLLVHSNGGSIISLIKNCYKIGESIQDATFKFVHELFSDYGLIILLPDNANLKTVLQEIAEKDVFNQFVSPIVNETSKKLNEIGYKSQVNPRPINLFYLKDNLRERIVQQGSVFKVLNSTIEFSEKEIKLELQNHPERFSPNAVLRSVYQEILLPNIAFIGGGSELNYWLQLKDLFEKNQIPFPVLVLRNSFLLVEEIWQQKILKLGFLLEDFFKDETQLIHQLMAKSQKDKIELTANYNSVEQFYEQLKIQTAPIDATLLKHVDALKINALKKLKNLEAKMLKAKKKKYANELRQIQLIKNHLFPKNGLQERFENGCYYLSKYGKEFINHLHKHSLSLEQEFVILTIK